MVVDALTIAGVILAAIAIIAVMRIYQTNGGNYLSRK